MSSSASQAHIVQVVVASCAQGYATHEDMTTAWDDLGLIISTLTIASLTCLLSSYGILRQPSYTYLLILELLAAIGMTLVTVAVLVAWTQDTYSSQHSWAWSLLFSFSMIAAAAWTASFVIVSKGICLSLAPVPFPCCTTRRKPSAHR